MTPRLRSRHGLVAAAVLALVLAVPIVVVLTGARSPRVADPLAVRDRLLGRSSGGRAIHVIERGDSDTARKVLVVGCIHGNECAGIKIAETLETMELAAEADLWIVENANPDGLAAGTRTNGRGVDLNRNFPWRWRRRGQRGDLTYAGSAPLSEPESRLLAELIRRVRPAVTIWFHQPLRAVDESGGDVTIERRFASRVGLPVRRLTRYGGGATGWQNHRFPGTTAFVVELPRGPVSEAAAERYARAIAELSAGP